MTRLVSILSLLVACDPAGVDVSNPTADTATTTTPVERPDWCPPAESGRTAVTTTDAGPYFLQHPTDAESDAPVIVFIPGGQGTETLATMTWDLYIAEAAQVGDYRVVMPYADDGDLTDEMRADAIADEMRQCFGSDDTVFHLAGTSFGGLSSFSQFVEEGSPFSTLMGLPGAWDPFVASSVVSGIGDRPVAMYVGSEDGHWFDLVEGQADALIAEGVDVEHIVLQGEGHVVAESFDEGAFFDWWDAHAP